MAEVVGHDPMELVHTHLTTLQEYCEALSDHNMTLKAHQTIFLQAQAVITRADEVLTQVMQENARLRLAHENIANLASGWDEDGALGPVSPLSWETVARMAMDYARAAIEKATAV